MEEQVRVLRSFFAQKKQTQVGGQQVAVEGQSISEEMCTLKIR